MQEKFAVIGGSGAYDLLKKEGFGLDLEISQVLTPFGESAPIHRFCYKDISFLFLSRHGENNYSLTAPFINYRANIWGLKECGVERIIAWSGPGIINQKFSPGEYALPDDLIDETKKRTYTFFENKGLGFIRMHEPFCTEIRNTLKETLSEMGLRFHPEGTYVCTEGPRLETKAEIRKYAAFGGDLVGMTLVPELYLAKELEICYGAICYLTNYAEGIKERPYEGNKLFEGMLNQQEHLQVDSAVNLFPKILPLTLEILKKQSRGCSCSQAMSRYRKRGDIGEDWKTWIKT